MFLFIVLLRFGYWLISRDVHYAGIIPEVTEIKISDVLSKVLNSIQYVMLIKSKHFTFDIKHLSS